jgi:hypothetical protein
VRQALSASDKPWGRSSILESIETLCTFQSEHFGEIRSYNSRTKSNKSPPVGVRIRRGCFVYHG